jgi:hypothetical protein
VIAIKLPLPCWKDRLALILLTLEHKENLRTHDAINKYRVGRRAVRKFSCREVEGGKDVRGG